MKKLMLFFVSVAFLLSFNLAFAQGAKIAVFNLQKVLQNDPAVKVKGEKLKKALKPKSDAVLASRSKLIKQIQELIGMPASKLKERKALSAEILKNRKDLRGDLVDFQKELIVGRQDALSTILQGVRGVAKQIAMQKGYDIVMTDVNMAYVKADMDITNDIIAVLKKKS